MMTIFVFLLLGVVLAFLTGKMAGEKGYSAWLFFVFGLLLPIVALLIVVCLRKVESKESAVVGSGASVDPAFLQYRREAAAVERKEARERAMRRRVRVARDGVEMGVLAVAEIVDRIESGELAFEDHWLDAEINDWRLLRELDGV